MTIFGLTLFSTEVLNYQQAELEFPTSLGINISTKTISWELHGIDFYGQATPVGVMCMWPSTFGHIVYLPVDNIDIKY